MKLTVSFDQLFTVKNNVVIAKVQFTIRGVVIGTAGTRLVGVSLQGIDLVHLKGRFVNITRKNGNYTLEGIALEPIDVFGDAP